MTVIELDAHRKTAMQHLVDVALRLERDENVDHWELADSTFDAVRERIGDAPVHGSIKTGQWAAIEEIRDELREAGATQVASKRTLRNAYSTARAWPEDERVEGANYWAHYELTGSKWANRKRILQGLVQRHNESGRKGQIGTPEVRLRKSDDNKPDLRPRDAKLEAKLRTALKSWASPQTFAQLHPDERTTAEKILYRLANEIASGEFA